MLVFAAACGDDNNSDNGDGGDDTPAAAETPSDGDGGDNDGDGGDDGDAGDGDDAGGGGDLGDLQGAAGRFNEGTFDVTYSVSGAVEGISSFRMVKDGPDRLVIFIEGEQEGATFDGRFVTNGEETAFCTSPEAFGDLGDLGDLGIDPDAEEVCFGGDSPFGAGVGDLAEEFQVDENVEVVSQTEREIAGEDADCFETRDTDTGSVTTGCIGRDTGAILYIEDEEGGVFEASEVSGDVDDSVFEIPEITEFPGLMP